MTEQNIEIINEEVMTGGLLNSKAGKIAVVATAVMALAGGAFLVYKKVIKKKKVNNEVTEVNE